MNYLKEWGILKMGSLLNNPNLNKDRDPLERGADITPKDTFKVTDLETTNEIEPKLSLSKTDRITFYANVRIDNHIKNKAEALSSLGLYKSQKEAIDEALDYLIDSLSSEDKRRLKFQIETLEERDIKLKNK